jgi:hypothetical protein
VAILVGVIPIAGWLISVASIAFGIVGLAVRARPRGMALAGLIEGCPALVIGVGLLALFFAPPTVSFHEGPVTVVPVSP